MRRLLCAVNGVIPTQRCFFGGLIEWRLREDGFDIWFDEAGWKDSEDIEVIADCSPGELGLVETGIREALAETYFAKRQIKVSMKRNIASVAAA